jgi:serine/threonine protein kinase
MTTKQAEDSTIFSQIDPSQQAISMTVKHGEDSTIYSKTDQYEPEQSTTADHTKESIVYSQRVQYKLKELLGEGGMGQVWKAECIYEAGPGAEDDITRDVAVKFVKSGQDIELKRRLVKEARLIARLSHENIVRFEDWNYLEEDQSHFIVMEYIPGMDIHGITRLHGLDRLPEKTDKILRIPDLITGFILYSVGNGLAYAHNFNFGTDSKRNPLTGIIHRDISPGNILIKLDEGTVKITDFGLAATREDLEEQECHTVAGKLQYLSPEALFDSKNVDARTDIYSLGIVAYEMLTGLRPNETYEEGQNLNSIVFSIMSAYNKELVPPHEIVEGVDRELSDIVCKMLSKKPEQRYQTATKFVDAIGRQYIYRKGFGPTKAGLKEYIYTLQGKAWTDDSQDRLRFLRRGFTGTLDIKTPYRMKEWARKKLEKRQNPSRVW